jgi:hypothetical protein
MSHRVLVDTAFDGTQEIAHFNSDGDLLGVEYLNDVETVLDRNKALQNQGNKGYGESREWKHVASIPPSVLLKWAADQGVSFDFINSREGFENIVLKMIKDPDYRYLRTDV